MGNQIVVLGMHRSGTSAVTQLIHQMGAYFGRIEYEMPPSGENPKGFWERTDVMEINNDIFKEMSPHISWFSVTKIDYKHYKPSS